MTRARRFLGILNGCLSRHACDAERSLSLIEKSAQIAWLCHAGTFVLPQAERLLLEHPALEDPVAQSSDWMKAVEGRTLHVLTEAYAIGGHTPLVKRWIDLLDDEPHAVVLVRQGQPVEPSWVVPMGRHVPLIDLHRAGLSRRARVAHLRNLFHVARRVILHIHPNDACSVAAAYRSPHAEIHFLNHADHVAWLGAGLPVVLLNLRHRGTRLAEARRGIAAAACGMVPVPITRPADMDRREARQSFGIGDQECLVLTIASGYKFNPVGSRSLFEPLDRLLRRWDVKLMAVGVDARHPVFGPLAERHPGQVLCMGTVPSPTRHRAAADIYLDSYPFCSITSMLESAALGTPVVAYQPDPEELEILYSECPWLPADRHPARDVGHLVELLDALIDDRSLREEFAVRTIGGMEQHSPRAWRAAVQRHLARDFAKTPWRKPDRPFRDGLLDQVLSGLMGDVRSYTDQAEMLGLDEIGLARITRCKRQASPEGGL
jgi:glycosyltransferase involved in cell wall biosynthesis